MTLLDCELYLPKFWVEDEALREKCHIPEDVEFQTGWQLAAGMVKMQGELVPHRWVVGDENYGRPTELRDLGSSAESVGDSDVKKQLIGAARDTIAR